MRLRRGGLDRRTVQPRRTEEGMVAHDRDRCLVTEIRQTGTNLARRFPGRDDARVLERRRAMGRVRQPPLLDQAEDRLDGRALRGGERRQPAPMPAGAVHRLELTLRLRSPP